MRYRTYESTGDYLYNRFTERPIDGISATGIKRGELIPPPPETSVALLARGIAAVQFKLSQNISIPLGLFKGVTYMGGDFVNDDPTTIREAISDCNLLYMDRKVADDLKIRDQALRQIFEQAETEDQYRLREQMQTLAKPLDLKIADAILYLSNLGQTRIPNQTTVAFQANTTRPSVNQAIQRFTKRGYVLKTEGKRDTYLTGKGVDALTLMSQGLDPNTKLETKIEDDNNNPVESNNGFYVASQNGHRYIDFAQNPSGKELLDKFKGAPGVTIVEFPRNKTLFREGDESSIYYFVAEGLVYGYSENSEANRFNGALFTRPSLCGEAFSPNIIKNGRTCEAYTDTTILQIDRRISSSWMREALSLRGIVDAGLEADGIYNTKRSKILSMPYLDQKLAAMLLDIKERLGFDNIEITQDELSCLVNATRASINKIIGYWKRKGVLTNNDARKSSLKIENVNILHEIAGS